MTKCNLCLEDAVPRCVAACRTHALVLGSGHDADAKKRNFAREMIGGRENG
jgi:Fe-S-cluster-containing hydrogenase component 2